MSPENSPSDSWTVNDAAYCHTDVLPCRPFRGCQSGRSLQPDSMRIAHAANRAQQKKLPSTGTRSIVVAYNFAIGVYTATNYLNETAIRAVYTVSLCNPLMVLRIAMRGSSAAASPPLGHSVVKHPRGFIENIQRHCAEICCRLRAARGYNDDGRDDGR